MTSHRNQRHVIREVMRKFELYDGPYSHHNRITCRIDKFQADSLRAQLESCSTAPVKVRRKVRYSRLRIETDLLNRVTVYIPK